MAPPYFLVLILTIFANGKTDGQHHSEYKWYSGQPSGQDVGRVYNVWASNSRSQSKPVNNQQYSRSSWTRTYHYQEPTAGQRAPKTYYRRIENLQPISRQYNYPESNYERTYSRPIQHFNNDRRFNSETNLNSAPALPNHRRISNTRPTYVRPHRQSVPVVPREFARQPSQTTKSNKVNYAQVLSSTNFCSVDTCERNTHTMCKYKTPTESPACGNVKSSTMTSAEIKEVLDKHNELRMKVARGDEKRGTPGPQPAATNLKKLVWNKELAKIAQTWANQCIYKHDKCRHGNGFKIGQNIAYQSWSDSYHTSLSELVNDWYEEVKDFDSGEVKNFKGNRGSTLHYSQMIWAATTDVGCGVIRFNHPQTSGGMYRTQIVCNYAPMGNTIEQSVYKTN